MAYASLAGLTPAGALCVLGVLAAMALEACSTGAQGAKAAPPEVTGRTSLAKELSLYRCPAGSFSGTGFSVDYEQALNQAVSMVSVQIESSVQTENLLQKNQRVHDGEESLNSSYSMNTRVSSKLRNRQDVHVAKEIARDDSVGILACMSLTDAARPYRADLKKYVGEFQAAASVLRGSQHPRARVKNFEKLGEAYLRLARAHGILQSLGAPADDSPGGADMGRLESEYALLKDEHDRFRSDWKFYYEPHVESDAENALWAELQKRFDLSSAESCTGGLKLSIETFEPSCKEGGFGISCTQSATLTGESCEGVRYFSMDAVLKGVGKDGEDSALERIPANAAKSDGVKAWIKELEGWEVK